MNFNMNRAQENAYAAGIIDGEGCIGITRATKGVGFVLTTQVGLCESGFPVLDWLAKEFDGNLSNFYQKGKNRRRSRIVCWSGSKVESLLLRLQHFLVIKAKQADLALRFMEWRRLKLLNGGRKTILWDDEAKRFGESCWGEMRCLNAKGHLPDLRVKPRKKKGA